MLHCIISEYAKMASGATVEEPAEKYIDTPGLKVGGGGGGGTPT